MTQSAWSEYSATPYLHGFSAIAVDENNAQWLYAFAEDGIRQKKLIPQAPIGYHAWLDQQHRLLSYERSSSQMFHIGNLPEASEYFYYANGRFLVADKQTVLQAQFLGGHAFM